MKTRRRPIEEEWEKFERKVLPADASDVQRSEMKKAFYAGSASLFHLITRSLDPGTEATEADLQLMTDVSDNIDQYYTRLAKKVGGGKVH